MMKLLVTGGCGFIGSALCRMAIGRGHPVINLDALTYAANPANVASIEADPNYTFEKIDIRNAAEVCHIFERHQPDAVIHLAAETHVDRSIDGPGLFLETNVFGTFNLLQAARAYWDGLDAEKRRDFRFLHVSTDEVYGDLSLDDPAFTEETPYAPSSPYSASKASSDHLVRAWHRTYDLPVVLTNCSNNYGPFQFPEKLIPVVILKALQGEAIPVYGTGTNIRDWLYVEDHADALLRVLRAGEPGRTYNIGGNNERTNIELVRTICAIMDKRDDLDRTNHAELITFVTDRPGHDQRYSIDASRARGELGWEPKTGWNDGFEKTVDWYLNNRAWWRPLLQAGQLGQRLGDPQLGNPKG